MSFPPQPNPYPIVLDCHGNTLFPGHRVFMPGPLPETYPRIWDVELDTAGSGSLVLAGARKKRVQKELTRGTVGVSKITEPDLVRLVHFNFIVVQFEQLGYDIWLEQPEPAGDITLRGMTRDAERQFESKLTRSELHDLRVREGSVKMAAVLWLQRSLEWLRKEVGK